MKKLITTCAFLMLIIGIYAQTTFTVGGIVYSTTSANTVAVTTKTPPYTGIITIPSSVVFSAVTYNVTSIGSSAFAGCTGLTLITIPSSITSIGGQAFFGCTGLTSITIPNSITSIGGQAFYGCTGLTSITIPSSITSIVDGAFVGCIGLTSITIPSSVTTIGSQAFYGCTGLISITIPSSVTSIGGMAFYGCTGLISITIPSSVTSIGGMAFYFCTGLTCITIPSSVTSIGDGAFYGTAWYNNQPNGLVYAGNVAYKYIGTMPASTSITLNAGTTGIADKAFSSCTGLTSITIPSTVTSIGSSAFSSCPGLTSLTIPSSVISIGFWAFYYCTGLTSITISNSVTSIGYMAFYGCTGLTSIYTKSTTPVDLSSSISVFSGVNNTTCILYVPTGSLGLYQAANQWKDFINIEEISTGLQPINQSNIKIMIDNGKLIISNAEIGSTVQVFTVLGIKVKEQCVENDHTIISLISGIYLLRVGIYSGKVIVK